MLMMPALHWCALVVSNCVKHKLQFLLLKTILAVLCCLVICTSTVSHLHDNKNNIACSMYSVRPWRPIFPVSAKQITSSLKGSLCHVCAGRRPYPEPQDAADCCASSNHIAEHILLLLLFIRTNHTAANHRSGVLHHHEGFWLLRCMHLDVVTVIRT